MIQKRLLLIALSLLQICARSYDSTIERSAAPQPLVVAPNEDRAYQASFDVAGISRPVFERVRSELKTALSSKSLSNWYSPIQDGSLQSESDFERAFGNAQRNNDSDRYFQLALQAFIELPVADNLPQRVKTLVISADEKERTSGNALDESLSTPLLELFDSFKKKSESYILGRFFRADHLGRTTNPKGAQEVLRALLADPETPDWCRPNAAGFLGLSLEQSGDLPNATAAFSSVANYGLNTPGNAGWLLRAVFINLHSNQTAAAINLIKILEKIDPAVVSKGAGGAQIKEFVDLYRSGKAQEFWALNNQWWPQWEDLEKRLKLPPAGPETADPFIANEREWTLKLTLAARTRDTGVLFQTLRIEFAAARWLPDAATVLASMISSIRQFSPEVMPWYRPLVLSMLGDNEHDWGSPESNGKRKLVLASYYLEDKRYPMVFYILDRLESGRNLGTSLAEKALQLRGLAAIYSMEQRETCIHAFETELEKPALGSERTASVLILAGLYESLGRTDDELRLLKHETENPDVQKNAAGLRMLKQQYARIQQASPNGAQATPLQNPPPPDTEDATFDFIPGFGDDNWVVDPKTQRFSTTLPTGPQAEAQFIVNIKTWLAKADIHWLNFAEPANLSDPRLKNLGAVLFDPADQFTRPELVKVQILATQDPTRGLSLRRSDWDSIIRGLCIFANKQSEVRKMIDGIADDPKLEMGIRVGALWNGIYDSFYRSDKDDFERWIRHPIVLNLSAEKRETIELFSGYFDLDRNSPTALVDFLKKPAARRVNMYTMGYREAMIQAVITVVLERIDQLGDANAMAAAGEWLTSGTIQDVSRDVAEIMRKNIRTRVLNMNTWEPVHQAVTKAVLEHFPELATKEAPEYEDIRSSVDCDWQSKPSSMLQHRLYMIKATRFARSDIYFWMQFLQILNKIDGTHNLELNIIRGALAAATDDGSRARLIAELANSADNDDGEVRKELEEILKPYRQPFMAPLTYAAIRMIEINAAERLDGPVDLDKAFNDFQTPGARWWRISHGLRRALQSRNIGLVQQWLAQMSPQEVIRPDFLSVSIPALDMVGRSAEAARCRLIAEQALKQAILSSWAEIDDHATNNVWELAELLNRPGILPSAWIRDITQEIGDPWISARVLMTDAWLDKRWSDVIKDCDEQLRWAPHGYAAFWYKGAALYHLGRKVEARGALATFTKYRKDSRQYPEAVAMLNEINGVVSPAVAQPPVSRLPALGVMSPDARANAQEPSDIQGFMVRNLSDGSCLVIDTKGVQKKFPNRQAAEIFIKAVRTSP